MWVQIVGRGVVLDADVRERVERRLGFALGRFGDRVGRVAVHLSDVNGPRGGVDKRCRIVAEVPGGGPGPVVVEDAAADLDPLIDRAADRVGQSVRRRLDRARLFPATRTGGVS
jgi:ribosome-associated translation inhibitor RaiA